ncbi:MAG: SH3 domain-containing protein [Clostridia bacterium]|nr:SH3 domain-containing protein [Clostridia bacterium]
MFPLKIRSRQVIISAVLMLFVILTFPTLAGAESIKLFVDGKQVSTDVDPYIDSNNRTMVPLRFVSESLGANVDWTHGEKEISITKGSFNLKLYLQKAVLVRNGEEIKIDTAPVLKNNRAMVPIRFVSEHLGCEVVWNHIQKAVYITSGDSSGGNDDPDEETSDPRRGYVTGSVVNIRTGPGTNYAKVGQVTKGTMLLVYKEERGWYRVSTPSGLKGWISGSYVSFSDSGRGGGDRDDVPGEDTDGIKTAIVIVDSANIRNGPSTSYPVVSQGYLGEELPVIGEQGIWYKVKKGSTEGFISSAVTALKVSPAENSSKQLRGKIVVLDPGHGVYKSGGLIDPGAMGPSGLKEKDVVPIIAKRAGEVLSSKGATVIYTRIGDSYISLSQRAQLANSCEADVFVSIHCNASLSPGTQGTSTYYYVSAGMSSTMVEARKRLASLVQEELVKELGRNNLGIREGNFLVVRETKMPSILVETAFISNPTEEGLLANPNFCRRAGEAIARGIIRFFEGS